MSFLLTGASGFLGRHLLGEIFAEDPKARPLALVRDRAAWDASPWTREYPRVQIVEGSLTEPSDWIDDPRLDSLTGIFHLAARVRHSREGARELYATHVEGTRHVVGLAARARARVVFLSTSGTVGCFRSPRETADEGAPYAEREIAHWPYYHSKMLAERAARSLADELGVELVIVRPPVLLGPGDHRFRSSATAIRFLRGRLPFLIEGGIHFVDVRDASRAIFRSMTLSRPRAIYHLCGTSCSVREFFRLLAETSGRPAPRWTLPYRPAWLLARLCAAAGLDALPDPVVIEMASKYWGLSSRFAESDLGFAPRSARETLADLVDWLRKHHPELRNR